MEKKELALTDIKFAVNYTPSQITIENEEHLEEIINQVTAHYGDQVFSDSNITEARESRTKLNKMVTAMEDKRKEIKRDFTKPLESFEEVMKGYVDKVQKISDDIGISINKYDEEQKAIRLTKIKAEMEKLAELFNVESDVIEVHTNWLAKSSFTTKGEVRPKIIDEIKDKIKIVAMERDRVAADKATVTDYAELAGLDPYAWANMVDQGWSVADIREKIKAAVEDKRLRELEMERARAAEEEYQAAMTELERSQSIETTTGVIVNPETGEVISSPPTKRYKEATRTYANKPKSSGLITATLKLTGTVDQMQALNDFIVENEIQVVPVE